MSSQEATTPNQKFYQKTAKEVTYFPQGTRRHAFMQYLESFGVAQLITRTLLAPIERWRLIRQTQGSLVSSRVFERNFVEFLSRTPKEQGFLALWRGNSANCYLYLWQTAIQFLLFENINNYWRWQTTSNLEKWFASAANVLVASFISMLVTYPIESAKVRMSNQFHRKGGDGAYRGVIDTIMITKRRENIRGLYRGLSVGVTNSALYFIAYQAALRTTGHFDHFDQNVSSNSIAEQTGAIKPTVVPVLSTAETSFLLLITTLTAYPFDTIKHRLQLNNHGIGMLHINSRHLIRQIVKEESLMSLYRGLPAALARQFLGVFLMRELVQYKQASDLKYF